MTGSHHNAGAAYLPLGKFLPDKDLAQNEIMAIAWAVNEMTLDPMTESAFWRSLQSGEAAFHDELASKVETSTLVTDL